MIPIRSATAPDRFDEYRQKVAGTNIDPRSLLSTDYFNTFNSVIMLLDMLPDAPDLLDEIVQWQFYDYVGHFKASGLDFAALAIEAYEFSPADLRAAFDSKVNGMRIVVEDSVRMLRHLHEAGEDQAMGLAARQAVALLQSMMSEGNAIVHGNDASSTQANIDALF